MTGDGIDRLERELLGHLPEGEALYPEDFLTDQPERSLVAETVREKLLRHTRAELPFSTAVTVDTFDEEDRGRILRLYCTIYVEQESQKGIVIGRGGEMLKRIGTEARQDLEAFFETKVFLDLRVKVNADWRDNDRVLDDLGVPRTSRRRERLSTVVLLNPDRDLRRSTPRMEMNVLISRELAKAFNEQIGHEFGASMQYVSIAAHFSQRQLKLLSKIFFEQADEEKQHAMKFVQYLLDTKGGLAIPAIPAPAATFATAEDAVGAALKWEQEVTGQITALMDLAVKQNDYLAQSFLQWFIDEQLEEVVKMDRLLSVIKQSGEKNLLMVEAYLIHIEKAG